MRLLLLLALAACTEAARSRLASDSERLEAEGDHLAAAEQRSEALLAYRGAVAADARNAGAAGKLAAALAAQGRRREASRVAAAAGDAALAARLAPAGPAPRWLRVLGGAPVVGVALEGDALVAATEDGVVARLDRGSGAVRWQARLGSVTAAPLLAGDAVYVPAGATLVALDAASGAPRWRFAAGSPLHATPLLAGGRLFLAATGALWGLDAADGGPCLHLPAAAPLHAAPALVDGALLLGSTDGWVRAFAVSGCALTPTWGFETQGPVEAAPVVAGDLRLVVSGDSRVYALDATGGERWRRSTPDGVHAAPLLAGDLVVVASSGRALLALDAASGAPRWQLALPGPLHDPPARAGARLVVAVAGDPRLRLVDLDGEVRAELDTGDWPSTGPLVFGGVVYLGGKDGAVLALDLPPE